MWQLYRKIGSINSDSDIVTEFVSIADRLSDMDFIACLGIMGIKTKKVPPLDVGILFSKSLIYNDYTDFQLIMRRMNGSS